MTYSLFFRCSNCFKAIQILVPFGVKLEITHPCSNCGLPELEKVPFSIDLPITSTDIYEYEPETKSLKRYR